MRTERLAKSGLLGLVGSVVAAAAAFAVALVVGNALGAYGTGLFFQAVGIFTIASQVLRLGTNSGIVRVVSNSTRSVAGAEAWRTVVIAAVPVAVLSTLVAGPVVVRRHGSRSGLWPPGGSDRFEGYLRLMAPFIPAGAVLLVLQMASRMLDGIVTYTVAHAIAFPITRLAAVVVAVLAVGSALQQLRRLALGDSALAGRGHRPSGPPFVQDGDRAPRPLETLPEASGRSGRSVPHVPWAARSRSCWSGRTC